MNVCVVYGIREPHTEADMIFDPEFVRDFHYLMDIYIDSAGVPIYGMKCSLDSETGKVTIAPGLRTIIETFRKSFNSMMDLNVSASFSTGVIYRHIENQFDFTEYEFQQREESEISLEYSDDDDKETPEESVGENCESFD
jgi:hypothetical protein